MNLSLHMFGDPVLRTESRKIETVTPEIRSLAEHMIRKMHAESGIGLAAQQVGRTESICVVDLPAEMDQDEEGTPLNADFEMPMVLLNPVVEPAGDDEWTREEGCLSFPDINAKITRSWTIRLHYMTLDGDQIDREVHGMLARVIQHEVDHLNGVLFIDHMSHVKKIALKGRLKRLRQETQECLAATA